MVIPCWHVALHACRAVEGEQEAIAAYFRCVFQVILPLNPPSHALSPAMPDFFYGARMAFGFSSECRTW